MTNQVTVSRRPAFVAVRLFSAIRFILLGIAVCGVAQAQTLAPAWTQQTPAASPPARYIHAMTYDSGHGQVVLFGGFGGTYLNDTWLWNGSTWAQANPVNSPPTRAAAQMAYDPRHGQVVLFGGLATVSSRLGDTWLWDGANWTQASPANSPPARDGAAMVYDAATGQMLLFGGVNGSGFEVNDTWAWDGTNWTQLSPTNSPSVRADYSMVYDAATGQVVLFGGDSNQQYQNDTWVWNGTNWIQQSPSNSPPARSAQGMAYDPALGAVIFGGNNGAFLNDTWVWNGSNWVQDLSAANPPGRYAPNGMVYDAAQNQVVLFGGLGNSNGDYSDTWVWGLPGNFGNVNVCPSGQTTPAPCSTSLTFTYNIAGNPTLGAPQVVTQGSSGLDFTLGNQSTCTGSLQPGVCTVNVTFQPTAPGLRLGAVELYDYAGILQVSSPIYGNGLGPAVAFWPSNQIQINTGAYSLNRPKGLAVDAAGDVFISNTGVHSDGPQTVLKIAPNGAQTVVASGLLYPQGLAVDGAGDLFIADNDANQVYEVPVGCTASSCEINIGTGLTSQLAVAVDPFNNVFISDFNDGLVTEIPANGSGQTVIYNGGTNSDPDGLAVDAAGNLYISDFGLHKIIEVPAGCTLSSCQTSIGLGWSEPESLAVDAAGDVFVADYGLQQIVEVPAGCTTASCQLALVSGINALALALDAKGNLYYANFVTNSVYEILATNAPASNFPDTNVGSTSGPVSFALQNVGNQPLHAVAPGLQINAPNFVQVAGPGTPADCTATFSLIPGAQCNVSIGFVPQSAGPISDSIFFTDNALNSKSVTQAGGLAGTGIQVAPTTVPVPNVVALTQAAATTAVTAAQFAVGTVTSAFSSTIPTGSVVSQSPSAGTQATAGALVSLVISTGQPPAANQLSLNNNYFVTGDYVSAGVTLRGSGVGSIATGTITIPSSAQGGNQGVPNGADILAAYLYWESIENTASPSSANGKFQGYSITGQQIGSDQPYTDGSLSGTLRVYRANVNAYLPVGANGIRSGSGAFAVALPDGGGALPLTEGASLVVIYRVLSPNFPLKSIVLYDGSAIPTSSTGGLTQTVQGFYDAVGGANGSGENTNIFAGGSTWNNSSAAVKLGQANQYTQTLSPGNAYAAVIVSTPVNNSDNDGILDAWKAGPPGGDVHAGQPGYYDVFTGNWVALPGAQHGHKDLFVQLDYMCSAILTNGACDFTQQNLYPSPDASGNDPIAMVQQAFAASGVSLHLQIGNAVPETTCVDSGSQLCEFPNEPGVVSWDNSVEISKVWPRNFSSCAAGGDCTPRFAYGQKDSWHYVLFGFSLAIPAWNTRYGTLTSINVVNGVTTIGTTDRGAGINACPSRITLSGVLGNPSLNGVYNTASCSGTTSITVATPGVPNWTYPNSTLPEPVIGLTSGTVTSISGYSDLGGSDSAVTLGLWETAPNQDMSKAANVIAGTLFHEIGHTLGLSHGGLYYDSPGSYVPTFEANCKPNFQSSMNYLFQLDGVGPNLAVAFSNQSLTTVTEAMAGGVTQLTDPLGNAASFATSSWYVPYTAGSTTASPATRHCDGTPLTNDSAYRVTGPIAPITPAWSNGQNIAFDGQPYTSLRGYNDVASMDLRQVAATGGEFASLASVFSFGTSAAPLNLAAGGSASLGSGGTVTLGSGGTVTLGSGGNVTLGSGGTITLGSGGNVTLGSGGNVTLGSGGTVTPGSSGNVTLGSGGNVTLGSGGTITLGSGGNVTLGSGGNVTLGSGGTITLGSGGVPIVIAPGGSYVIPASGGTVTLGSGGNVTLGSGGNVTLGSGGTITLGSGGTVTLGSGGNVTLGSGGTITLGSGGNVTLGSGGNVTLGSGGTIALGSGGNITLGSGGNVTLGSGGTVTLGGDLSAGSGGNVTLGSGGNVTLGSGGTVTLGSGGNVTLGSGGNVTLGSGGTIALGSGGTVTLGSGGNVTLGSGGTITLGSGGSPIVIPAGGSYTIPASGGTVTLGSGGNVTLGSGGNVTLGSGGTITLGSGGNITLGSGGNVTLGSGGVVTLGSGGNITLGSGGNVTLGSGGNVTLGSGGAATNELTYETANSVVRPPSSPTETPLATGPSPSVQVNWTAPVFGVVQTYTIYRSSNGGTPVAIGSVSGVNGNPPATTFIDTNPDLTSQTVVYTITTTLAPVPIDPTARSSQPSAPAVLSNNQTISLGPLPSSVTASSATVTVTATALSSGVPNGQQVSFAAAALPDGACTTANTTINASGVSSATVAINSTGSCKVTASQTGSSPLLLQTGTPPFYNAADPVSGTFTILPANSGTTSQTITFTPLGNVQYGNTFHLSASSSAGQMVSFASSGPCTTSGTTTGAGLCTITASALGNGTYSAASVSQSFTVFPAVLKVTATSVAVPYGQTLPTLTYTYSGFMNSDLPSVVSGAPVLTTTATAASNPGNYPITVSTGTLAAANYSFLYVPGTLTIQLTSQAITFTLNPPSGAVYGSSFSVAATGGASGNLVTFSSAGACSNAGALYTMTSGTGMCSVIANQAGNSTYGAAPQVTITVIAGPASPTITWPTPAAIAYGTALSATQLNASANVPGMFSYSPIAGTVLTGGMQTLSVTFTPNDSVDYKKQTASVLLVVNESKVVITGVNSGTETYGIYNLAIGPAFTGSRVPTGTVTVIDNGIAIVKLPLLRNGLASWITIPALSVGVHNLTASYSGDAVYPPGLSAVTSVTVVPAHVTIQASCVGAQVYGSTYECLVNLDSGNTVPPSGKISYSLDGAASVNVPIVLGLAAFVVPGVPSVGPHTLVLSYAAQGNFAAAAPLKEAFTTQPGQTQIQLSASNSTPAAGSSVVLSGSITTPVSGTPSGSVTLLDGTTVLGTRPIGVKGVFSYTVTAITKGAHTYTAKYAATQNYAAATSKVVTVTAH